MESQNCTVEQLTRLGGRLWEQGGRRRVYFNALRERIGLDLDYYYSGNICHASLNGETISNSQARSLVSALDDMKIWYDLADGEFHYKTYSRSDLAEQIIAGLRAALQSLTDEL